MSYSHFFSSFLSFSFILLLLDLLFNLLFLGDFFRLWTRIWTWVRWILFLGVWLWLITFGDHSSFTIHFFRHLLVRICPLDLSLYSLEEIIGVGIWFYHCQRVLVVHFELFPTLLLLLCLSNFFFPFTTFFLFSETNIFESLLLLGLDAGFFLAVKVESVGPPFVDDNLLMVLFTSSESLIAQLYSKWSHKIIYLTHIHSDHRLKGIFRTCFR